MKKIEDWITNDSWRLVVPVSIGIFLLMLYLIAINPAQCKVLG